MKFFPKKKNKKVFIGLSGGVDSSVSAAILKRKGYDVTGVFIKVWQPDFLECTWEEDRRDAMRVCSILNIPFLTFDFEKEYKDNVVDYMIKEYELGCTPNPDVMCNKYVKFGAFLDKAISMGADFVATGHYAQKKYDKKNNIYRLISSNDSNKDQTYFLWTITQKQLKHVLFPVGRFKKPKVRKLAKKFKLPTADKKDSQGLCFIGEIDMKSFLKHFIKEKKGNIIDVNGDIIGEHDGVLFYTIGQRHGFRLSTSQTKSLPHYIIKKDVDKNTIMVSSEPEVYEENPQEIVIKNENWISNSNVTQGNYLVRYRHRQKLKKCKLLLKNNDIHIKFENPQQAISKGQSIVLYKGKECVGGGIIN